MKRNFTIRSENDAGTVMLNVKTNYIEGKEEDFKKARLLHERLCRALTEEDFYLSDLKTKGLG